jgi:hypothetical protein
VDASLFEAYDADSGKTDRTNSGSRGDFVGGKQGIDRPSPGGGFSIATLITPQARLYDP